jgi:hypothetical protein
MNGFAQTTYRKAEKMVKDKAIKDARKEAKKWRKEGYSNLPGQLHLDKQFERSMVMQVMLDEEGNARYIGVTGTAVAGSENAAQQNALNNTRLNLAGQVQAEVSQLISANVGNTQFNSEEAETIDEFISNSKTLIQQELGAIQPVISMRRVLKNKNVEFRMSVMYDINNAKNVARKIIKRELKNKLKDNEEDLDKLLGIGELSI